MIFALNASNSVIKRCCVSNTCTHICLLPGSLISMHTYISVIVSVIGWYALLLKLSEGWLLTERFLPHLQRVQ